MAVPSSGEITILGIFSEKNESDYSAFGTDGENDFSLRGLSDDGEDDSLSLGQIPLNTAAGANPPNQTAPYQMSEFYGYDHDFSQTYKVFGADDWNDGDIGTGTRDNFTTTDLEASTIFATTTNNNTPGTESTRLSWSSSPQTTSGYTFPAVVSDTLRFTNTDNPHGMFMKISDPSYGTINITNVPTADKVCWRFRFFMNSTNNKDGIADIRMSTINYSPHPAIATSQYTLQIKDNSDPQTGAIRLLKRFTTTHTQIALSTAGAYTLGTTQDILVYWGKSGTGRAATFNWNVSVAPTTTPTSDMINTAGYNKINVTDSSYPANYGWSFRTSKAMSVPTSTHFHAYDVFSVKQIKP
jgi:hypothetical protein